MYQEHCWSVQSPPWTESLLRLMPDGVVQEAAWLTLLDTGFRLLDGLPNPRTRAHSLRTLLDSGIQLLETLADLGRCMPHSRTRLVLRDLLTVLRVSTLTLICDSFPAQKASYDFWNDDDFFPPGCSCMHGVSRSLVELRQGRKGSVSRWALGWVRKRFLRVG